MAVKTEVPVSESHLEIHSVIELRRRALACHVPVTLGYHSVTVEIHELVLYRVAVWIILLLVGIVCIRSIAYHLAGKISSSTLGNVSDLDVVVIVLGRIELGELRVLECSVETQLNAPVGSLDRNAIESELQSHVTDRTYVCHELVAESRAHRHLYGVQKILGITHISVNASTESVLEESEVKSEIIGHRGFPFYCRIVRLRSNRMDKIAASHIVHVGRIIGDVVACKMYIVTYAVLLSGKAGREPKLEGGN